MVRSARRVEQRETLFLNAVLVGKGLSESVLLVTDVRRLGAGTGGAVSHVSAEAAHRESCVDAEAGTSVAVLAA